MNEVGIIYGFRVVPDDDKQVEALMREIFAVMEAGDIAKGQVSTFALYRDPPNPGRWYLFESLSKAAAERDPSNIGKFRMLQEYKNSGNVPEAIRAPAEKLTAMMAERAWRQVLEPVLVHGCGELVPGATERRPDSPTDVGAYYKFRVAPKDDKATEQIMRDIFTAMESEEYPTNEVMSYTLYRDPTEIGTWVMYEHFTAKGAAAHAGSAEIVQLGYQHLDLMIAPYERYVFEPVIVRGCGEPIGRS
jgi:quinol monooxygenase YgiN